MYTNEEADRVVTIWNNTHPDKITIWKPVDKIEILAFIGLLITSGALHCRKESLSELWSTSETYRRPIFTAGMSRDRFIQIYRFIRFDDKVTRQERKKRDKLAAIREVCDMFVTNCQESFSPYENITIDEQLVAFRGKCPFRQYIKSKPAKYGIKVWICADVKTSYVHNLQVYTGKLEGNKPEKNQGMRVVCDLLKPMYNSGRSVTTDNFFTSVELAEYLLTKKITLLGTIRKNKPDTPSELCSTTGREAFSSRFAFYDKRIAMVSYMPKKNKMVHVLSTQHLDDEVSNEEQKKPIMILDYNSTKGAVDNADKLTREYTCSRRTSRWPLRLFMNMLDIATLNSYIIWIHQNPSWNRGKMRARRQYLLDLGKSLALPNMQRRLETNTNLQKPVIRALAACGVCKNKEIPPLATPTTDRKRARCYICPRKDDNKTTLRCSKCQKFICSRHRRTEKINTCYENCANVD